MRNISAALFTEYYIPIFVQQEQQCQSQNVAGGNFTDSYGKHHKEKRLGFAIGKTQDKGNNQCVADYRWKRYKKSVFLQSVGT